MIFFKAFKILVFFHVIFWGLLLTVQGNQTKAKVIELIESKPSPTKTPVVAKDAATTKTPALKSTPPKLSPPNDTVSAIIYSKDPKKSMILFGDEILRIGDKSPKYPNMDIIDIKPDSVVIKDKGKQKELFLKK